MATSTSNASPEKDIIIVGGSIAGLMHGITLRHLGHQVRILEQAPGPAPDSHMAGVGLAGDVQAFLKKHMSDNDMPIIRATCLQMVDVEGTAKPFMQMDRKLTSWDALYERLRRAFEDADGSYTMGRRVTSIVSPKVEGKLRVTSQSTRNSRGGHDEEEVMDADLLIGADGPNSAVRRLFLPAAAAERKYAGYVAWRGCVREDQVSEETRKVFRENITYTTVLGGHAIVYNIPGKDGSLALGERYLNFCWYADEEEKHLPDILTDNNGHVHHASLGPGQVREEIWDRQRKLGNTLFKTAYKEVLSAIDKPFIQVITDYSCPHAAFADGRVLLVGDAQTLVRPHIAFSTNQAAFHCGLVEKLMRGEMSLSRWDADIARLGYLHWRRSIWFGEWFRRPLYSSISFGVHFWLLAITEKLRFWAGFGQPLTV